MVILPMSTSPVLETDQAVEQWGGDDQSVGLSLHQQTGPSVTGHHPRTCTEGIGEGLGGEGEECVCVCVCACWPFSASANWSVCHRTPSSNLH